MIRNRLVAGLALVCAMTAAACEDSDPIGPTGEVPGTYALVSVNGDPLPFEVFSGDGFSFEILADTIEVGAVDTFRQWTVSRETTIEGVIVSSDTITGTYVISDNRITFTAPVEGEQPDRTTAILRGTTIRIGTGLSPLGVYQRLGTLD